MLSLRSRPTGQVTCIIAATGVSDERGLPINDNKFTFAPAKVTFLPSTYQTPVDIGLAGVKDGVALGRLEASLEARCESRDPDYSAAFPLEGRLALLDADVAELILLSQGGDGIAADGDPVGACPGATPRVSGLRRARTPSPLCS